MQEGHKKYSFPYRSIEAWNKLDAEVINAININYFKSSWIIVDFETGEYKHCSFFMLTTTR